MTDFFSVPPTWFVGLFEPLLLENDIPKTTGSFWKEICVQSAVLATVAIAACWWNHLAFAFLLLAALCGVLFPFGAWFFFLLFSSEQLCRKKEEGIPELLLSCSAFAAGTDTLALLRFGASSHFGLLGKEFEKACLEIQHGATVEQALYNIKKRGKTPAISRMVDLLVIGYESGIDLSRVFREAAEDLFETRFLLQERQATGLVQKYTLLLAGGLIVPSVLGLVGGMVKGLDFSALNGMEFGLTAGQRQALLFASQTGTVLYLAAYALLASFFVAQQEGNWKKGFLYAGLLLPLGLGCFWIAGGF